MLASLQGVAAWVGPIVTILGAPTVIVGFIITVRRVRRWLFRIEDKADGARIESTRAHEQAKEAAERSATAAVSSSEAAKEAAASNETSRLNSRGLVDLKQKYDDLFGAYASLLGLLRMASDETLNDSTPDDVHDPAPELRFFEPAMTTGKHRLPTTAVPTTGSQETASA